MGYRTFEDNWSDLTLRLTVQEAEALFWMLALANLPSSVPIEGGWTTFRDHVTRVKRRVGGLIDDSGPTW